MKNLQFIFITLFALTTVMVSCKKDNSSSGSSSLSPGKSQISCSVSGAVSSSFSSSTLVSTAAKNSTLMNISGSTAALPIQMMMFAIPTTITVGTHNLSSSGEFAVTYTNGSTGWAAGNAGDDFTLVVTKNDGAVFEGTFSGKLTNDTDGTSVTITNGKIAGKF